MQVYRDIGIILNQPVPGASRAASLDGSINTTQLARFSPRHHSRANPVVQTSSAAWHQAQIHGALKSIWRPPCHNHWHQLSREMRAGGRSLLFQSQLQQAEWQRLACEPGTRHVMGSCQGHRCSRMCTVDGYVLPGICVKFRMCQPCACHFFNAVLPKRL